MFATKFEFNIAKPCTNDWNEMTPNEQGRFCDSCQERVVDLTSMTDRQIIKIYEQNQGKLCGRTQPAQLNRSIVLEPTYVRKTKLKAFTAIVASILGFGHLKGQEIIVSPPMKEYPSSKSFCDGPEEVTEVTNNQKTVTISGKVTDEESGVELPFANVILELEGTAITGTTTDLDGNYSIEYQGSHETIDLRVVYVGYMDKLYQGIPLEGETDIHIEMPAETLENSYILGYFVVVKKTPAQKVIGLIKRPYHKLKYAITTSYWYEERRDRRKENKATRILLKETRKQARLQQTSTPEITEIVTIDGLGKRNLSKTDLPVAYPNPFNDELTVTLHSKEQNNPIQIVLFDMNGIELLRKEVTALQGQNNFEVDVHELELPDGSYFLSLFKEGEIIQTVIVEKIR